MDRTDSGFLVLGVASVLFVVGMGIGFARQFGWVCWPARTTRTAGLAVVAATAGVVLLLPDVTGPQAFFRDLEQLDIYGSDQQTVMLQRGQTYCTLNAPADDRIRQQVFAPDWASSTAANSWTAPLARWSVRRLCPDRTDLLPVLRSE